MNYKGIVNRIVDLKSDELNDREVDFLDKLLFDDRFETLSDRQKKKIIEINRKYIATR